MNTKFFATLLALGLLLLTPTFSKGASELAISHSETNVEFLYEEDPTLLTTTLRIVFLTGLIDEPFEKAGITNLLSELMLRGTKTKSRQKFQNEVEQLGASLSVDTSHDKVVFTGEVIRENTKPFLTLVSETILNPSLSPNEFEDLKREIRAEIQNTKNSPQQLGGLAFRKALFQDSILQFPVRGTFKTINSITLGDLKDTYKKQFHQGNLVFAAASSLPKSEILSELFKIADKFPQGTQNQRSSLPLNIPEKLKLIVVHKPKTSSAYILAGQTGIVAQDPYRFALDVGNFAYGGEPLISRLFRVVRSELGWTYSIGSTYTALGSLSYQRSPFVMHSSPSVEFSVKALFKMLTMWKSYLETGIKNEELKLAQNSLINSYPFRFESAEKRLYWQLYSYLYKVPVLNPEQYSKTIRAIDHNTLKRALQEHHKDQSWLITIVADKRALLKQLKEEQKSMPIDEQLKISQIYTPEEVIQ